MARGRKRVLTDEQRAEKKKEAKRADYIKFREKRLESSKRWRENNRELMRKLIRENLLRKRKEFEEWKSTLKCARCPETHVACLEFHHLDPSLKDTNISELRYSKKRRETELEKCIVLCSNCHKKLHWEEGSRGN